VSNPAQYLTIPALLLVQEDGNTSQFGPTSGGHKHVGIGRAAKIAAGATTL
tara:strand:- start:761 stop:913 length:153 start_codon:yes stop_codon:yes gene_type:complete